MRTPSCTAGKSATRKSWIRRWRCRLLPVRSSTRSITSPHASSARLPSDNGCLRHPSGRIRLALIFGGRSGEHEISIRSAESIKRALDPTRYSLAEYFIDKEGKWHPGPLSPEPGANPGIDVVFPALHGTFGEDGTVQGLLELAGLPYVGSDVLSSAAAMDKAVTKKLCLQAGLPVVPHIVLSRMSLTADMPFGFPMFVKPANLGSSVGIRKVKNSRELTEALEHA